MLSAYVRLHLARHGHVIDYRKCGRMQADSSQTENAACEQKSRVFIAF